MADARERRGPGLEAPGQFEAAVDERARAGAQLRVFDRFLARIVAVLGDAATLKGGLVLGRRLERARTTKDVDLRMMGSPDGVLAKLQETTRCDLGDFMTFLVGPDDDHPEIKNDGMQYHGLCLRAECRLAGKLHGQPFGDPILGEPDVVVAEGILAFAGIALRRCGSIRSRRTSPRSCTRTRCPARSSGRRPRRAARIADRPSWSARDRNWRS